MPSGRPDIDPADEAPPVDRSPGPTGLRLTLELSGLFGGLALPILALVAIGTWLTDAIAIVLMLVGVFLLTRWVQRVAWTRSSRARTRRGPTGMNEDLAITGDVHEDISVHDLRPDNPARREVEHRTK
jgi:hypothetical protein